MADMLMSWFGVAFTFGGALGMAHKFRMTEDERHVRAAVRANAAVFTLAGTALLIRGVAGLAGIA